MIVVKFGGTSVGDSARVGTAIEIVRSLLDRRPAVVVSALAGVTNELVAATHLAAAGRIDEVAEVVRRIRERHERVALELVKQKSDYLDSFLAQLGRHTDQVFDIFKGIALVGEVTRRANDKIVTIGEKLSSVLFAYSMRLRMLPGVHVDSEEIIVTDENFGEAAPLMEETTAAARRVLIPELERNHVPVMGGFIGRSVKGATTTLGRGGSDYSAAIIGAAIGAEEIQIWTDVDGMMTCDPRVIPAAKVIDRISYVEAAELAYFGAKVLHPKTISPAVQQGIPIRVLNTHNLESRGTLITREGSGQVGPRAIAVKHEVAIVHIVASQMLGVHGFLAKIFEIFDRYAISVDLVTTSEVSVSVTVDQDDLVDGLVRDLERFSSVTVVRDQSIVAVVGRNVLADSATGAAILRSLSPGSMSMLSLGTAGLNLSFVVPRADADPSVRGVHRALFETPSEMVA
jgi:aspartate kinase